MMKKVLTLCLVREQDRVLLGMKKRGFGEGRWNGFGGKVQAGESIEAAATRELREEAGIRVKEMEKRGIIEFEFKNDPVILEVHIFGAKHLIGEPSESDEMRPQWFSTETVPFDSMWPDDRHWFPLFLAGKKFKGHFLFDGPNTILSVRLSEVSEI